MEISINELHEISNKTDIANSELLHLNNENYIKLENCEFANLNPEYEEATLFKKLKMKIENPNEFKKMNWPIITFKNYEYSYTRHKKFIVYFYCRFRKSGCVNTKLIVNLEKNNVKTINFLKPSIYFIIIYIIEGLYFWNSQFRYSRENST